MKTVLIIHHVSDLGGGTKSLIDMAIMLKEKYKPIVCVPKGSKDIRLLCEQNKIEIYETNTPIPSLNVYSGMPGYFNRYFWTTLFRFSNVKKLVSELMIFNPDAVFFNTSVTALIAKALPLEVKKVCIVRETFVFSPFYPIIRNNFEKRFDGIAYIAEHEKNVLNVKKPFQIVIPDCLDSSGYHSYDQVRARKELGYPLNCFYVLYMGGLTRIKGLDVLLKAAEQLDEKYKIIVAGKIDKSVFDNRYIFRHIYQVSYIRFLLSVRRRLDKLSKSGKVIQTGYVNDISPYMAACDTVVFPSTSAHQPRPCIEAGNYERSCILSDYEATKEYFKNGYNSITFKPHSYRDLTKKIVYLQENPELNKLIAHNNKKMSLDKHDFKETQKKLSLFFDKILEC